MSPEPVELVVDGIDADLPAGPEEPAEATPVAPDDDPLHGIATVPGPPPLPGARGPRRTLPHLPAETADRVQASLRRLYLDRTLRRSPMSGVLPPQVEMVRVVAGLGDYLNTNWSTVLADEHWADAAASLDAAGGARCRRRAGTRAWRH